MSLYRAYFVPEGMDPLGLECTLDSSKGLRATGFELQKFNIGGPPSTGEDAERQVLVLEAIQKALNVGQAAGALANGSILDAVGELIDNQGFPSAGAGLEGLQKLWNNNTGKNKFDVALWVRVSGECCVEGASLGSGELRWGQPCFSFFARAVLLSFLTSAVAMLPERLMTPVNHHLHRASEIPNNVRDRY